MKNSEEEFWVRNVETGVEYFVSREAYEACQDIFEIIKEKKDDNTTTKNT